MNGERRKAVASYAEAKTRKAKGRGGDDLALALIKPWLEHPISIPPSVFKQFCVNGEVTPSNRREVVGAIEEKRSKLEERINGSLNYRALFWNSIYKTVSATLTEKTYVLTGDEIGVATQSLDLKSEHGTWLKEENANAANRYGRLLDRLSDQVRNQSGSGSIDDDAVYTVVLGLREKRRLRRALKHAQTQQKVTIKNELHHKKRARLKATRLAPSRAESDDIENSVRERAQQNATKIPLVLHRLGYMNPDLNGYLFGLR